MNLRTITADLTDTYRVELRAGRHVWYADEPEDKGGDDTAPNPYEMLLGALAACTLITVKMVAEREEIPVEAVSATFTYEKIHADDCHDCNSDVTGYLDRVETDIYIDGSFTDAQAKRLERVVTKCPVHKTLEKGVHFSERLHVG